MNESVDPFESTLSTANAFHSQSKKRRGKIRHSSYFNSRSASVEFPIEFDRKNGLSLAKGQRMSIDDTFSLARNWNGTLHCSSVAKGSAGTFFGRFGASCLLPNDLGTINGAVSSAGDHKELHVGLNSGAGRKLGFSAGISLPFSSGASATKINFGTRLERKLFFCQGRLQLIPHSQRSTFGLTLSSRSRHKWSLGLGAGTKRKLGYPFISGSLSPTFNKQSSNLVLRWNPQAGFSWAVSVRQRLLKWRASVAVSHNQSNITWTLVLADDNLTIRVPILLGLNPISLGTVLFETMMLSGCSQAIHLVANHICGVSSPPEGDSSPRQELLPKERREALRQQEAMKSKASQRMQTEQKENGLVVLSAKYFSEVDFLDVTIPLQFWVLDSKLTLSGVSKESFLGFCPLERRKVEEKEEESWSDWVKGFWTVKACSRGANPDTAQLTVRYRFGLETFELTIDDDDELSLPSVSAKRVRLSQ